ncbi:rhamnose ABC transporter substrate-binding protein, partial [bacterium]
MSKTRRRISRSAFLGLLAALLFLPGCGSGSSGSASGTTGSTATGGGDKPKIAFIVKQPEEPWFQ